MMTDFPTVGLAVDLSGIAQGEAAYDRLQQKIEGVGAAAATTSSKVQAGASQQVASVNTVANAEVQGAAKGADAVEAAAARTQRARTAQVAQTAAAISEQVALFESMTDREASAIERATAIEMQANAQRLASAADTAAQQGQLYAALSDRDIAAMERAIEMQLAGNAKRVADTQAATTQQAVLFEAMTDREVAAMERGIALQVAAQTEQVAAVETSLSAITRADLKMWVARLENTVATSAKINAVIDDALAFADAKFAESVARQTAAAEALVATRARILGQLGTQSVGTSAANQGAAQMGMGASPEFLAAQAAAERDLAAAQAASTVAMNAGAEASAAVATQSVRAAVAQTQMATSADRTAASLIAQGVSLEQAKVLFNNNANAAAVLASYERQLATASAEAVVATEALTAANAEAAAAAGLTGLQVREVTVAIREISRGDLTRLSGTLSILANSFGLITAAVLQWTLIITAAAAPFAILIYGIEKGEEEMSKFQGSLIATGNYAGLTAGQLNNLATSVSSSTDTTIGSTRKLIEQLAASGKFTGDSIASVTDIVQNYSRITGESADKIAQQYEGMKDHLVQWAVKHEDVYHDLTLDEIDQINWLVKHGQEAQAQEKLLADIDAEAQKRAKQAVDDQVANYGILQKTFHNLAIEASSMWDAILGIGRDKTPTQIASGAAEQIAKLQAQRDVVASGSQNYGMVDTVQLAGLDKQIAALKVQWQAQVTKQNDADAKAAAESAAAVKNHDAIQAKYGDGKSHASTRTPVDRTDNVDAQVQKDIAATDALIATAKKAELQADLAVTNSAAARAAIQEQMDGADYDKQIATYNGKIADIEKQIAAIGDIRLDTAKQKQVADLRLLQSKTEQLKSDATYTQTMKDLAANFKWVDAASQNELDLSNGRLANQAALLSAQAKGLKSAYARAVIEDQIAKLEDQERIATQQRVVDLASPDRLQIEQERLQSLKDVAAAEEVVRQQELSLAHAVEDAAASMGSFKSALANHDWAQAFDSLMATIQTVQAAFAQKGMSAGLTTAAGATGSLMSGAGGTIGKVGNALSVGAGISGTATAVGGMMMDIGSMGTLGAASGGMLAAGAGLMAVAAPLAIVAGVAILAASLLKSKPSNYTADAVFNGVSSASYGGDKPNANTTQMIQGIGQGVLQAEQALKGFGLTLNKTVQSIQIGQRDPSQIVLSDGSKLTAGVGDAAAATEAALDAVLRGATYTDDTEKKLVNSMLDAGQGFDAISTALQNYQSAQAAVAGIQSSIDQIQDPVKYATDQVVAAMKTSLDSLQAALDAGYLSADDYATAVAKVGELEKLQMSQASSQAMSTVIGKVTTAQQALNTAYSAAQSDITKAKGAWDSLVTSLKSLQANLTTGTLAALSPQDQYTKTKALFESTSAAAKGGDQTAMADLTQVSTDYLNASKAYYATTAPYYKDLAEVQDAVSAAASYAQTQSDIAQEQLNKLDEQVGTLLTINQSVLSVGEAINQLNVALAAQQAAQNTVNAANSNSPTAPALSMTQRAQAYMDAHHDIRDSAASGWLSTVPSSTITDLNGDGTIDAIDRAIWHYNTYGKAEGLAFANGGAFDRGNIVNMPTRFNIGQMGEAGPEAIMPLARGPGGRLGVQMHGGGGAPVDLTPMLKELKALRQQMVGVTGTGAQAQVNAVQSLQAEMALLRKEIRSQRGSGKKAA